MRQDWTHLERYRIKDCGPWSSKTGDHFGAFIIPKGPSLRFRVITTDGDYASAGLGKEYAWEHVSVSLEDRCPTWEEMDFIKDLFWDSKECVMQLHVPKTGHKNIHKFCLHMWRPLLVEIPRPPHGAV